MTKYRNVKTRGFDSQAEAWRYDELLLLERAGDICDLEIQPEYVVWRPDPRTRFQERKVRNIKYIADFKYREWRQGQWYTIVEDTKGSRTAVYQIKKKLFLDMIIRQGLAIEFREVQV